MSGRHGFLVGVSEPVVCIDHPRVAPAPAWLPEALTRLTRSRRAVLALLAVPALLIVAGLVAWMLEWRLGVDSAVYRAGALALLGGEPLYDHDWLTAEPPWASLPFTYPPTAALLFTPLAVFPIQVCWGLLGAMSVLAMAFAIRACIAVLPARPVWLTPARTTLVLSVLLLGIEPVWRTLALGQINLILMALIVGDLLVLGAATGRARRFGGVLVGVAAAVKLTPLIFVGHLLVTGRRMDALRALATFVSLQSLMLLLVPHDAIRFWGYAVTDPERVGPTPWVGNQSLNGLILRLSDVAPWSLKVAIGFGVLLAIPSVLLVRRLHLQGRPLPALLVTAFLGLLVSPVSWSHHWVWAVPLIVFLLSRLAEPIPAGLSRVARLAGPVVVGAVFVSCVLLVIRNRNLVELDWGALELVLGSAYLLVPLIAGALVLVRLALRRAR
jgi:alpha-1,2-mannosyltransferase